MKIKNKLGTTVVPKSFKLLSSTYKVELDNDANDWKDAMGLFSDNQKMIKLASQVGIEHLPVDSILDTYFHEVAHALVYNTGEKEYSQNEKFVDLLGRLIRQYLDTIKY